MEASGAACGVEHLNGAGGIRVVAGERIGDGSRDRGAGAEMHDCGCVVEHRIECVGVGQVSLDQRRVDAVEVVPKAGRQVVEGHDLADRIVGRQGPAQIRADEPGATGDHNLHPSLPPLRRS